jgi:KDO2-lipid IV(A) lauroyltransferase
MIDWVFYLTARALIGILRLLPLTIVAQLGRIGGGIFYAVDARHRRVAIQNISRCFPENTLAKSRAIARENFKRIGEAFASAAKTAYMTVEEIVPRCELIGLEKLRSSNTESQGQNRIVAIGHFANFELNAKVVSLAGYQGATTYRGIRQPMLGKFLQDIRSRSGTLFFERRTGAKALKEALNGKGLLLGLLADQHAGKGGLWIPFFGRPCSTTAAPAILALRYNCPLQTAICYRVGLGRWRFEVGDEIPLCHAGTTRSAEDITQDINDAFEIAIRRDPANWFWVHNRWKPQKRTEKQVVSVDGAPV